MQVSNWLLLGDGLSSGIGKTRSWHLPSRVLRAHAPPPGVVLGALAHAARAA
jgi:hypothetical protein